MDISVVILTFNSRQSIAETIYSAGQVSSDIHVVDSFSNDATCDIAGSSAPAWFSIRLSTTPRSATGQLTINFYVINGSCISMRMSSSRRNW